MLQILWDTRGYFFWLLVISISCWVLERLAPWRPAQRAWRDQFGQDLFWLVFNGHYAGILLASGSTWLLGSLSRAFGLDFLPMPEPVRFLMERPLWLQFVVFLIVKDFLEFLIHNLLHRVPGCGNSTNCTTAFANSTGSGICVFTGWRSPFTTASLTFLFSC